MIYTVFRFIFLTAFFSTATLCVNAQIGDPIRPDKEELPKGILETLARGRIEREKKDYEELLQRGAETAKLSDELEQSFVQNKNLGTEDLKKLERLEKLSKKIREELGAKDDDSSDTGGEAEAEDKIFSVSDAFGKLKNVTSKLSGELKKSTRYTISAVAIQSSNTILKIVRFLRQNKN